MKRTVQMTKNTGPDTPIRVRVYRGRVTESPNTYNVPGISRAIRRNPAAFQALVTKLTLGV